MLVAADHDHGDVLRSGQFADRAQRVEPVHARQDDVEEDQFGRFLCDQGEALLGVERLAGVIACRSKCLAQHGHNSRRVVNDQHRGALAGVDAFALAAFHGCRWWEGGGFGLPRRFAHTAQKPVEDAHGAVSFLSFLDGGRRVIAFAGFQRMAAGWVSDGRVRTSRVHRAQVFQMRPPLRAACSVSW
ncbi:hypothetical protein D3C71_1555580 [compost metagenome]